MTVERALSVRSDTHGALSRVQMHTCKAADLGNMTICQTVSMLVYEAYLFRFSLMICPHMVQFMA